jgi:uncharacterized protein YuzE
MYTTATAFDNTGMADEPNRRAQPPALTITVGEDMGTTVPSIYIQIRAGQVAEHKPLDAQVHVDLDRDGRVIAFHIAGARFIGTTVIPQRNLDLRGWTIPPVPGGGDV